MSTTTSRLREVLQRIDAAAAASGQDADAIQLVAVAKTATPEALLEAWQAGQRAFGHNRVQALEQHRLVLPDAEWHLLGPLQHNKVRRGLAAAQIFQALGDVRTLEFCAQVLAAMGSTSPYPVLLQVNLHPEDGRYGCTLQDLDALVDQLASTPQLHCAGLMTLALATQDDRALRRSFSTLHKCFQDLQSVGRLGLDALLSMGMSGDFETAIEEGANLVRVGRAIFPPPATY